MENYRRILQKFLVLLIKVYRLCISPFIGQHCRFYPTCSRYAITSIERFGVLRGLALTIKRLLKCHPWHDGGVDHVPDK